MSRCAPVAGKPICLEFMPEAAVGDILVAQVSWKAIPDMRPRDSETSVTECVVCAWNNTRSVGRRAQVTSRPFRDQMYVVRQVQRCMTRQRRENKTCQFEVNSTLDWKPVRLAQHWRDVFPPSSSSKKSSGGILDRLNLPDVAVRHAVKQRITIGLVQATGYERLD